MDYNKHQQILDRFRNYVLNDKYYKNSDNL